MSQHVWLFLKIIVRDAQSVLKIWSIYVDRTVNLSNDYSSDLHNLIFFSLSYQF